MLKDDNLLALFDIPKILWPRLRLPQRRRHHMITGRMDFCMDERGLKVYEIQRRFCLLSYRKRALILERWRSRAIKAIGFNPAEATD